MLRRALATVVVTTAVVTSPSIAVAQDGGAGGSLVQQVLTSADEALGAGAAAAVVRAYDRGYDLLQIIEALLEGLVAADGTITDEGAAPPGPLAPFREPSNVIQEDAVTDVLLVGTGETIALDVLERSIVKTTKKLDKRLGIDERAEQVGIADESLFTMLCVMLLIDQGYSPEQIILDGFVLGGIKGVPGYPGALLVDEDGKRIKPDGVEEAPEQEEAADQVDAFVADVVDTLTGIPPSQGAETPFKPQFQVDVEISITGDTSVTIVGSGRIGQARDKSLRTFIVGKGKGELAGAGECSLSEGGIVGDAGPHPYEVSGDVRFGFSGQAADGRVPLRIALPEVDPVVAGDDSFCVDLVRDLADVYETLTFGPVELRLRDGATDTARTTFGDATVETRVTLST